MIDKTHRFQGYGSLRFVYQKGKTIRGTQCSLKYILNTRRETYRAAVVVSRKVHKSAVVRNRIRRRIYEVVRSEETRMHKAFDLVFVVYNEQLATMPANQLHHTITDELQKAGAIGMRDVAADNHDIVVPKEK